ncbi:MAG: methyltransferase [Bdellovibrionales bacterium]|nr:methyltransferase [Bdellovibrionales bacterium]
MTESKSFETAANYYDSVAKNYSKQYLRDNLETGRKYPQNYYRLQTIVQRLAAAGVRSVYEVGTGEGTPLAILARMGLEVAGCDISEKMVDLTREHMKEVNVDPNRIQWADIEDSLTFANQLLFGPFDALIALGVMPHVAKDNLVLGNMRMLLKKGGRIHVEFRNKLFSLFTFNRFTKEFILDDLLSGVSSKVKAEVEKELDQRLSLDLPRPRMGSDAEIGYDAIRARYHNPFEVPELMEKAGFIDIKIHWYHYHSALPLVEDRIKQEFWEEASKMEHTSSWKGYFLCSAFWIEAKAA